MKYRLIYIPFILSFLYVSSAFSQTSVKDLSEAIANGNVALEQSNGTGASSGNSVVGVLENKTNRKINIDVYLSKPIYLKNRGADQKVSLLSEPGQPRKTNYLPVLS